MSTPAMAAAVTVNVPAQPVSRAIVEFARQTGVQVLAPAEDLRGKVTTSVAGTFEPTEALERMLAGAGLAISSDNGRTITLRRAAPPRTRPPRTARVAPRPPPPRLAAPDAAPSSVDEVVITGSHLSRSGFSTPSPVTVVSAQSMDQLGLTNVGVALNQLPAFRADLTPNSNGFANFNLGAVIANLRGLGATRTLVLIDGHRFITSTREGSVDMNLIPTIMVDRSEIVTGGASAAYGSDAVAGAINVILDTRMSGLKARVNSSITQRGDGKQVHVALAGGTGFAGGRGHIVAGGEYEKDGKIGTCFTRDYCTTAGLGLNPAGPAHDNSQPYNVLVASNYGYLNMTPGGIIPASAANPPALHNLQFDPAGNLVPYNPGVLQGGGFSVSPDNFSNLNGSNLAVPVERYNFFSQVSYALTPTVDAFLQGSYAYVHGTNVGTQTNDPVIGIKRDNAFAPPALKSFFAANPTVSRISMGRLGLDMGRLTGDSSAATWRIAVGLNGELGGGWRWRAFYDQGGNNRTQSVANNRINANFFGSEANTGSPHYHAGGAVDAVVNPSTGQIVCRSTIDRADPDYNPNNGCVPVDLFGINKPSAAARAYINRTNVTDLTFSQQDASLNLEGKPLSTWAGPVGVAGGVEYRRNTIRFVNDPIGNTLGYYYNYGASYAGSVRVVETYGETDIPLAADLSWARALNLNLAGRRTWYHNKDNRTGKGSKLGVTSWKVSLVYDATDWLRLRTTRSRDIRAANFNELYTTGQAAFLGVVNPWLNTTDFASSVTGGRVNLQPEKGDTYTAGAVFSPTWRWLEGFRASIDYYRITLRGAIGNLSSAQLINDCFTNGRTAPSCARITFEDGFGSTIVEMDRTNQNLSALKQSGIDIEAEYRKPLNRLFPGSVGDLSVRVLASYVAHQISTAGSFTIDRAGMTGPFAGFSQIGTPGMPRLTATGTATYDYGRLSVTLQGRFVSSGVFNASLIGPDNPAYNVSMPNSINDNTIPSRTYFNLAAQYDLPARQGRKLQVFGSISNLFDRAPPLAPGLIGYSEPAFYDLIGRTFHAGLRLAY